MQASRGNAADYAWAAGAAAGCTAAGLAMAPRFDAANIALLYLLCVVLVALRGTRGAAILASALATLAFNWFFVPPRFTLTVDDPQYLFTFAILLGVGLLVSSLAERSRAQALEQSRLALEAETERVRSTLLASISHDLRTPLAVLAGASSALAERGERMDANERQALAASLVGQARELAGRVDKVLQMTRLERGEIELERDWVALAEVAGTVLARLEERLSRHRVLVEIPADLPLVRADAALLEHALGNLLENAARHTPEGTVVRLRGASSGNELVVSVEDFGPGLPEADLERVFAKFHHGSPSGGLGLGLAICRAIVRLHGGRAWAESVPAGGTAFRFCLPVDPAPPVAPEPHPS